MGKKECKGFYTLEAAMILPLFACFAVFLMLFFRALMVQWGIDTAMEKTGKMMALYGDNIREGEGKLQEIDEKTAVVAALAEIEKNRTPLEFVQLRELGLDFHKTKVTDRQIDLVCSYRMPLLAGAGFFGKLGLRMTSRVKVGRWTGFAPEMFGEGDGDMVYVTDYGEAYHESLSCSYLKPSIHAAPISSIGELRSRDGSIYYPCKDCGRVSSGVVFYTDYGNRYHSDLTCSGLKRSIRSIPRSEAVKKYRPCPKCTKGTHQSLGTHLGKKDAA